MARLTKADAARQLGIARSTFYKLIAQGKVSATADGLIESAELVRVAAYVDTLRERTRTSSPVNAIERERAGETPHGRPQTDDRGRIQTAEAERSQTSQDVVVDILREQLQTLRAALQEAHQQAQAAREREALLLQMLQQAQQRYDRLLDTPRPPPALGGRGESEGTHAAAGGVSRSAPTRPPPPRAPRPSRGPAAAAPLSSTSLPANRILGKLCPRGHDYQGTGQSLLYVKNRVCVVCDRARQAQRRG